MRKLILTLMLAGGVLAGTVTPALATLTTPNVNAPPSPPANSAAGGAAGSVQDLPAAVPVEALVAPAIVPPP